MTDPIFPLPDPTFLWVHDLLVHPQSGASATVDEEGRWRYDEQGVLSFVGYVASPSPAEITRAASTGVRVDAVALAPNGTVIDESDDLEVPAADNVTSGLVGRYQVTGVRPNPSHTRVLLTRIQGEAVPPNAP